jgi:hypothetical protein
MEKLYCRLCINFGAEGKPPLFLPLAGSVTINAETTVHCSILLQIYPMLKHKDSSTSVNATVRHTRHIHTMQDCK